MTSYIGVLWSEQESNGFEYFYSRGSWQIKPNKKLMRDKEESLFSKVKFRLIVTWGRIVYTMISIESEAAL